MFSWILLFERLLRPIAMIFLSFFTFLPVTAPPRGGLHFGDPVGHKIHLSSRVFPIIFRVVQGRYLSGPNDNISRNDIIQQSWYHPITHTPKILQSFQTKISSDWKTVPVFPNLGIKHDNSWLFFGDHLLQIKILDTPTNFPVLSRF